MREVYWIGDRFIVEKEELKVNWERIMNDIKKDYLED